MKKWEDEIEDILAKSGVEPTQDWQQLLPQIMRMMKGIVLLSLGRMVIHSPEARERIRKALAEEGMPPEVIEQTIYWLVKDSTRPIERKRD